MTTQTNQNNTLTLRDQFAMAALTGLLAGQGGEDCWWQRERESLCWHAYLYADTMLAERDRAENQGD